MIKATTEDPTGKYNMRPVPTHPGRTGLFIFLIFSLIAYNYLTAVYASCKIIDNVIVGAGNDQLFAENKSDMATLITQGETAQSIN